MTSNIKRAIAMAAIVCTGAAASGADATATVTIGPPIVAPTAVVTMQPDTYKLMEPRTADPTGGPPWGMATYLAHPRGLQSRKTLVCAEYGRVVEGQLGLMTESGTFRPYQPGSAPNLNCGGQQLDHGERAFGEAELLLPERLGDTCLPPGGIVVPADPSGPCRVTGWRTLIATSLGRGILRAEARRGRSWERLPDSSDGLFLAAYSGRYNDATIPSIRLTVTVCGPDARTDIKAFGFRREGCKLTFEIPNGPRPARETAASKRARTAPRLNGHVQILQRRDSASSQRFAARLTLPISIQSPFEGYAYRMTGPGGRGCRSTKSADLSSDYISSYLMIAGKPFDLPILPLDLKRGIWCEGRYALQILFVHRDGNANRTNHSKVIATTDFRVR